MNILKMTYPWYRLVNGDELEQGDILEDCPVFSPPLQFNTKFLGDEVYIGPARCDYHVSKLRFG